MNKQHPGSFWAGARPAAKWALAAAGFMLLLTVAPFVVGTIVASISLHVSPITAIFGPVPGNPLIVWLYLMLPVTTLQCAVGLALRQSAPGMRVAGVVGTLAFTTLAVLWLAAISYDGIRWLLTGIVPGEFESLLVEAFFGVPTLVVIIVLNARAAFLGTRELFGRQRAVTH